MGDVKLVARWDGWCDPCGVERPLLLTAAGEYGPRAWLSGVGIEDRTLVLTCAVCGEWQLCPWDEEFPEEAVAYAEAELEPAPAVATERVVAPEAVVAAPPRRQIVLQAAFGPVLATAVPRLSSPRRIISTEQDDVFELLAEGLDLITAAR